MKADRDTFGPHLRLERERRGIELKAVADSTKIKESLFAELERNDFSKWPQGFFRRAHLCAYVSAIGLPSQAVLAEFLRLFPESPSIEPTESLEVNESAAIQQVQKPLKSSRPSLVLMDRVWVVLFDLALVCLTSSVLAGVLGMNIWPTIALVGLGYAALGSAWFGQSIGAFVHHRIHAGRQARSPHQPALKPPVTALAALLEVQPTAARRTRTTFSQPDVNREPQAERQRASA
jgi:hypothetical protein